MSITILIPSFLTDVRFGYLYGVHYNDVNKGTQVFYALDVGLQMTKECIGYFSSKSYDDSLVGSQDCANWFSLKLVKNEFVVTSLKCSSVDMDLNNCGGIICIVYNHSKFFRSELLVKSEANKSDTEDHFQKLAKLIHRRSVNSSKRKSRINAAFLSIVIFFAFVMQHFSSAFSRLGPILKYSSLGTHCKDFFENIHWALSSMKKDKKITIKVGNYILAMVFDVLVGVFFLNWLISSVNAASWPQLLLDTAEGVVETLLQLLKWIMGVPAGLKLNFAWNNILGGFFMYHINLWWTFLVICKPFMDLIFGLFLVIGKLGLSFQVSILTDLLALVSFHVYCIYVYAARLYNLQIRGLIALWRLFLGKKWNPLRQRVDSCTYSSEQLFLGTLAFTILFFLLPTTVMYYIVFAGLRLATVAVRGCLNKIKILLQSIPLYSSLLWIVNGDSITSTIQVVVLASNRTSLNPAELHMASLSQQVTLKVAPTALPWWATVCTCMPNSVYKSIASQGPTLGWSNLLSSLFSGGLIYPV
ncbi:phosphatidylinositol N-acetylglucosaminyltransferase subunit Q [Ischnura elegans]|uniref:phosphatidylinositol N-acetylglucosaminyltransferase subunit Q n=1 Tax=Ischnura elegans TaxID=197161 RepID=UPI001ED8B623|nr:phosphatidylinositol N-acetylglucosaminyltransferase subunit Q [Ischnura elegans]